MALLLCAGAVLGATPSRSPAQAGHGAHGEHLSSSQDADGYDPLSGVDPSGRIPRVELPEAVDDPDRWRYVPEGRIKPGNVFQRFLVSTFILPVAFFEEDVGAGGGFALTDIDFWNSRRRDHAVLLASYTTEGQQRYFAHWLRWLRHVEVPEGGVAFEERTFLSLILDYERTLTRRFFGLGADTSSGDETSYSDEVLLAELAVEGAPRPRWRDLIGRLGFRVESHRLSGGVASGVPDTAGPFPELFEEGRKDLALWLEAGLRWDTRDSPANPYRGGLVGASVEATPWRDAGAAAAIAQLDGRYTLRVPSPFHAGGDPDEENPPTDVVALGSFLRWTQGDLPFYLRPSLGGRDTLRGYIGNRWTGDSAWHAAAEYRFWFLPRGIAFTDAIRVERLGGALFYEAGSVATGLASLPGASVHTSWGFGLRLGFERSTLFRLDVGFSREGHAITLAHGLSF